MSKSGIIIVLLFYCMTTSTVAQNYNSKSAIRQARYDVRFFRLDKENYKQFLKDKKNSASDYFKPIKTKSGNSALFNDSVYVKEFKKRAYNKTRNRRLNNTMAVIGSVGVISYVALVISAWPTGK